MSELAIPGHNVPRAPSPGLWVLAWRRFGRDRVGVVSLAVVVFFCALMVASGLNLLAADWAQEAGINYAPPTFLGPDAVEAEAVTPLVAQSAVAPLAPKAATMAFGGD